MNTSTDLEGLGTDELHTLMAGAIQELPMGHPVRTLWERMDQILTDGGPECLPAPWDDDSEPEHTVCDAKIDRLTGEVRHLRAAAINPVDIAIQTVHQRGHEVALPVKLLEFLTGGAEAAALAGPKALPRDTFEVVTTAFNGSTSAAEELRCTKCGATSTQAGCDGQGWTLARLDLLADRHQCLPRLPGVEAADEPADSRTDAIQDCTCVEFCDEDPKTACSLSGRRHVHPASQGLGFGPCPVHPDAPGDH